MKKHLITAAMLCAALAVPGIARAGDAMSGGNPMGHDAATPAKMATMVCRPATASEKPTAMMAGSTTGLVCKAIKPEMMMKKGSGPKLDHALTSDQVDAAWREYVQSIVMISAAGGG